MSSTLLDRIATLSAEKRRLLVQRLDPLSFIQERLWFLHQFAPDLPVYNVPMPLELIGTLDLAAVRRATAAIAARHETLRTTFPSIDGQPVQHVAASTRVFMPMVDLSAIPSHRVGRLQRRLLDAEVRRVFDVERGPLWRSMLVRTASDRHVLMLTWHHIIFDGWSRGVLMGELAACYDAYVGGREPALPALPLQYRQFARWQRTRVQGDDLESQLTYWRTQLAAPLPVLELPTDRPRPPQLRYRGADETFALTPEESARLRALGREDGVTLFMTLVAAWDIVLQRYTAQQDLIVGTASSGRPRRELEGLIGCFVNTLALRVSTAGNPTVRELLARVREVALGAYAHQDVPFEKLVDELQPERRMDRSPIFQTWVMLQNTPGAAGDGNGEARLLVQELMVADKTARFDLALGLMDTPAGLCGPLRYATDLFDRTTILRLIGHYAQVLRGVTARPDARLSELTLLTDAERTQIHDTWNGTQRAWDAAGTLVSALDAQAARTPEAVALTFKSASFTYRELHARANQLARHLRTLGVGPDTFVGVCVERSPSLLVALLGVLKAGGAYIPLDPGYPRARLAQVLSDAKPRVLLTQQWLVAHLPEHDAATLCVDTEWTAVERQARDPLPALALPQHLAYAIYTSGSTGRPKGVMISHAAVRNFFVGMVDMLDAPEDGAWLAVTSPAFDISVLELIFPLTRGLRIVLQSAEAMAPAGKAVRRTEFSLLYFASDADSGSGAGGRERYRLLLDGARFADEHGFAAVWMPERHFHSFGGIYPNPSVTAAAVAAITSRVHIRAGSVVLPLHDPLRIVEEWAVVDNLSNGRVGLSFATGWHANDFVLAPDRFESRRKTTAEFAETVKSLWRGEAIVRRDGAGNDVEVRVRPKPVQPELPVWITASGSPDTFKHAGSVGAGVLTHLLGQTIEELSAKIAIYRDAWRSGGHGPGEGHVTLMMHTFLGPDLDTVRETVRVPFSNYLRDSAGLLANLARSLGQNAAVEMLAPEDVDALIGHAFERYFTTSGLFGTPEAMLEMVHGLQEIGVDEIACLIDFGVAADRVIDGLRYLSTLQRLVQLEAERVEAGRSSADLMLSNGVTHLQCTPSFARLLLAEPDAPAALAGLHHLMIGGEALPSTLASELRPRLRGEFHNMYGPTETTIWSSTDIVDAPHTITLGRPIANTQIYVLDRDGQLAPVLVPGEVVIGGDGLSRGYLDRPDLTADRFLPDAFGAAAGGRLYRTGDRGRWRTDGRLEFLGRADQQIKLRGYRVELGDIEAAVRRLAGIRDAAVVLREDEPGERRLVAYVVPLDAGATPSIDVLQQQLRAQLPDYMVPATIVALDALPLTPNGKIDRRRLPAPSGERPTLTQTYTAPRTPVETSLAQIWAEVLRIDRVGINDNFFALGGDSILSLQIVARATQAGLRIATRQVFEYQTVASLAQVVQVASGPKAEQAPVVGPVPLLPIQHWFFSLDRPAPHHYNQQVRLELAPAPPLPVVERAWTILLQHHDALRFRFARADGQWTQTAARADGAMRLPVIDLQRVEHAHQNRVQFRVTTAVQASLDLAQGPVVRPVLLIGPGHTTQLFIAAHHLVIDGVSWRVLIADFEQACRQLQAGERVTLPPKTNSVRQWADALRALATSDALAAETPVWMEMSAPAAALPRHDVAASSTAGALQNTGRTTRVQVATLTREETQAIVQELPALGVGQVQDLLLAALVQALAAWAGESTWRIDLEGHGREELPADIDISRTVGWFTSLYPVRLTASPDPLGTLRAVKATVRAVPRHGLGYGVLRYLDARPETAIVRTARPAEIIFNYLGQADQVLAPTGWIKPGSGPVGAPRHPDQPREYVFEINSLVSGGRLQMAWAYSARLYQPQAMEQLTNAFVDAVRALIAGARDQSARAARRWLVPADFPLAVIAQDELDRLAARGPMADLYPLSPMQQGLLFHSVYESAQTSLYTLRFRGHVDGAVDPEAFREAWQIVLDRHDILRTGFVWNRTDRPLQVVYDAVRMPMDVQDWRHLPPDERDARLAAFVEDDERRGFDLEAAPLMRMALIRLGDAHWYAAWTTHHLITDGWSVPLVMTEVLAVYAAIASKQPVPRMPAGRYRDYIAWIQRQDLTRAEAFWRRTLDGINSPSLFAGESLSTIHRTVARGAVRGTLSAALTDRVQQLGRTHALTLNTCLVGAWAILLSHYTQKRDVLFGAIVSGRPPHLPDVERTPGVFVNTLPVRATVTPTDSLVAWLTRLQLQQTEARDFEYTPLTQVQAWSAIPAGVPLFDTLFIYENYPMEPGSGGGDGSGMRIRRTDSDVVIPTTYPLWLQMSPSGGSIGAEVLFDSSRIAPDIAQDVLDRFTAIVERIAEAQDDTIAVLLDFLSAAEADKRTRERQRAQDRNQSKLRRLQRQPATR